MTDLLCAASSAGYCFFGWAVMKLTAGHEFLNCVTGWNIDLDQFAFIGERIANIQQAFNIREGLNPIQFEVHERIYKTPPPAEGPIAGRWCDIDLLVKDWYAEMDWDIRTGKPSKGKLEELGLQDVAAVLYPSQ